MKSLDRKLILVASVCLLIGIIIATIAFAMGGFQLETFSIGTPTDEKTYQFIGEKVNALNIRHLESDVVLTASDDNQFHITAYENDSEHYNISLSNSGELSVEFINNRRWYDYIKFEISPVNKALTIRVPKDYLGKIDVYSNMGDITISGLKVHEAMNLNNKLGAIEIDGVASDKQISCQSKSGNIQLKSVSSDEEIQLETNLGDIVSLDVKVLGRITVETKSGNIQVNESSAKDDILVSTKNGYIELKTVTASDVSMETKFGDIEAEFVEAAGQFSVNSGNGSMKLKECIAENDLIVNLSLGDFSVDSSRIAGKLYVKSSSGAIELLQTTVQGDVTLESRMGDISFMNLSGNNFFIQSFSGTVKGDIAGDVKEYTIEAKTKKGAVNVPHSENGEKRFQVSTERGDIDIDMK